MPENKSELKLTDLVDIKFLQKFQDAFSKIVGVACLTIDKEGLITRPSNFAEVCAKFTRNTKIGSKRCLECNLSHGEIAAQQGKPLIYQCHSGLTDFAVPIIVAGKHIASIVGGQVLTHEIDEKYFRELAKEIGVDENEYVAAAKKLKIVSPEYIKAASNLLFIVANAISKVANEKLELIKKNESEHFYRIIVDTIRSSLDINETREKIVNIIGKTMNADRCFITEYDKMTDKFSVMMDEYKREADIFTYKGIDINEKFPNCTGLIKQGKKIIINDKKFAIDFDTKNFYEEKEAIKKYKELSLFAFPLYYSGELLGCLSISYIKEKHIITEDEINLVNMISEQIAIAMYQAKLHKFTEKQAEREILLRKITETIRETLDIDKMKKRIVDIIGQTLKADRCFFMEYDKTTDTFLTVQDEYLSSNKIPKYVGADVNEDVPNFMEEFKKGSFLVVDNKEVFVNGEYQEFEPEKDAIKKFKVNSAYGFPFFHNGVLRGVLGLHYLNKEHKSNQDEISLLKLVADQIAISIDQAKLYQITQMQAEKEALLRKIISIISSSLDLDKVKYDIVNQVGMYLKADRVFFADYNPDTQKYSISETGEYLSSDKIQSLKSFDFVSVPGFIENIRDMHLQGKDIVFDDLDKYIEKANGTANSLGEFFRTQGFMSLLAINMNYGDIYLGNIVISYAEKRKITKEDIAFVKTITDQASFAVYQARLYRATQISAVREKLIGDVITKAISTFDLNEIKQIVNEVGVLTKADRCYFIEVDLEKSQGRPVGFDAEYLASPDIKSIAGYKFSKEDVKKFVALYSITKDLIVFDYEIINREQNELYKGIQKYSKFFGLKTCIGIPLHYMGKLTSVLIIEYVKEKVIPSEEELDFLRILGNQIGMAFNQIQLYQDTKKTAERETLLRNITENIRSSLDIEETLSFICEETARLFNVQRTAITSFSNPENYEDFTIRKEYKKFPKLKGLFDVDNISKTSSYWVDKLKQVGNDSNILTFDNVQKSSAPDYFKKAYKSMGVKSMIGTTIKKGRNIWGTLVLSEYNYDRQWSEEEKTLLKTIADQIYLAINQAELFSITKKQAEREVRLRNIIENIRSSLDIEKTLYYICEETAKLFNVQRVALGSFFNLEDFHDYKMRKEYKADPKIKGFLELDNYIDIAAYWGSNLIGHGKLLAIDNIKESDMPDEFSKTYTSSGAKSIIGIAINRGKNNGGTLVLAEYNEYRHWSEEEKDLLKTIANQIYLAINQAELFGKEKKTASNEKALREIMLSSVSTFEMEDVINSIVTQTGKLLNADRCFYVEIDLETHTKRSIKKYAEYLSSNDIKSHVVRQPKHKETAIFTEGSQQKKPVIVSDIRKIDLPESTKKMLMEDLLVKSFIIVPVFHGEVWYGSIVLHYVRDFKQFSQDEIDLVQAIANQTAVVINQAEIFKKEKKTADRELILRKAAEILRSTLDPEEIKKRFVDITSKYFDVDRCLFDDYNKKTGKFLPFRIEKLKSANVKSLLGINVEEEFPEFVAKIKKGRSIIIRDVEKTLSRGKLTNYKSMKNLYESDTKSDYGMAVMYKNQFMGALILHFTEKKRILTHDEFGFLKVLMDQVGVALHQAELLESEKRNAEREKLIGKIVTTAISTFDVTQIKQMVTDVGKITKADRCYFVEVDLENMKGKPISVEREYLSSPDITSIVGYDFPTEDVKKFLEIFLEVKDLVIFDYEKIPSRKFEVYAGPLKYANLGSLQNSIGIPFYYMNKLVAILAVEYVKEKVLPSEDDLNFFRLLGNQVGMAFSQIQLYQDTKKTAEREHLLRIIIETVRSSLNIHEVKKNITEQMGKAFNADRCYFRSYDEKEGKFLAPDIEYLSSNKIKSLIDIEPDQEGLKYFSDEIKRQGKGFYPIVVNEAFAKNTPLESYIKSADIKADYAIPIINKERDIVWLVLHYLKEDPKLSEEDKKLLETIAYQIDIAFEQIRLYNALQQTTANQNAILNNMPFMAWLKDSHSRLLAVNAEYARMCNTTIENIIGKTDFDFFPKKDAELYVEEDKLVMETKKTIPTEDPITGPDSTKIYETFKSPVFDDKGNVVGTAGLARDITERKEAESELLRRQEQILKANERERLYREIMEAVRSSLDINETKKQIVNMVGKTFRADRCVIVEYDKENNRFLPVEDEYLSSDDITPYAGTKSDEVVPKFAEALKRGKPLIINNKQIYLNIDNQDFKLEQEAIDKFNVNSALAVPLYYSKDFLGVLSVHYVKEMHEVGKDEITLMNMIADQVAIAIHQAELYKITQLQAERERVSRNIIETVRSSLDINETKKQIVNIIGKTLDADRCYILEYDKENDEFLEAEDEYLSSDDVLEYKGGNCSKEIPNFVNALKSGKSVLVKNKKIYPDPGNEDFHLEEALIKKYNINSAFAIPLFYLEEFLGVLSVHYVNNAHEITEDEIALMNMIANQISIAIHQARLFKLTKIQAEREKISRNIIEILRSSMDQMTIKRLFVKNIGKYFNADRVFFSSYDSENKAYLPVDENSEYLSSPEEKSFIGFDWAKEDAIEFIRPLLERREIRITAWDEYVRDNKNQNIKTLFEDAKIKSSYNFPVLYQQTMIGYFCIEFTRQVTKLADEDINRIRSICTQAGIALYQAELYQKVQESNKIKGQFIANISGKFREPLTSIIGFSEKVPEAEIDCEKQAEQLETINKTSKKLLDFTNYISDASNANFDKDIGEG